MVKRRTLLLSLLSLFVLKISLASVSLTNLQTNYQTEPLGIDLEKPRFSWQMKADEDQKGLSQTAYQIIVKDEEGQEVWNSETVVSGVSLGIAYAGKALEATTRYEWTVTVWTNDENQVSQSSWFETGLMNANPDLSAWDGATWIGGGDKDMVLQSHYLSVYKIQYQVQLEKKSTKAAFIFGANDQRLMEPHLNLNKMRVGEDESYVSLELDISEVNNDGLAKLHVYRVGYAPDDKADIPFKSFDIPKEVINQTNQYEAHQIYISAVFGLVEIFIKGMEDENNLTIKERAGFGNRGLNLNPFGVGNDFICFPMLADIGFQIKKGQQARFSDLQIRHYRQPSNILFSENLSEEYQGVFQNDLEKKRFSIKQNSYRLNGKKSDLTIISNPSQNAAPMLRTVFSSENKTIKKARIYATARGIYELYLNGQRVGNDYFNPGLTQYNKTHLYQTYDVTDLLQSGENAWGAWMSEGWWSGNITFRGENWNFFGDRQSLLAKLVITYDDGTEKTITTTPEEWQLFTDGPIRYGSFFQGEVYDANKESAINGWATSGYNPVNWKNAVAVPLEGNGVIGAYRNFMGQPRSLNYENQQFIGQIGENVSVVKTLTAQEVIEVRPGVFVYDMGQNMVGVPSVSIQNGQKGQGVRMRFAEMRYPDLEEYKENTGMVMMENIRAALTQDLHTLKGGDEVIEPRFTFHGYRFIEISGIEKALPLEAVKGKVLSSVKELASNYETSNSLVNRLWKNITWSLRGNFLSIPTDTPARNERMGWNGDINVFSQAATWLANVNQFLKRHLMAMRDMQAEDGRFSDVAPVGNGFGGTLWGSAGIVVPWEMYQQYGDTDMLTEHYDAMKDYVNFLAGKQNENGILIEGPLGDWLSPENSKNDNTLLWTAYQIYDLEIMGQVAKVLGKEEDAATFKKQYDERKAFFNSTYVNSEGKTVHSGAVAPGFGPPPKNPPKKGDLLDTQASYAIPLAFRVFNEENHAKAVNHLNEAINRKNTDDLGVERPEYSLMTGFIGTASIGKALSANRNDEVAYRLVQNESYPSWLYPVKNGATTIWERLNSYTIDNGFGGNNSMNSFNHYSFGAIAAWMYNYSLGIQRDPEHPGFKHFILSPTPDPTGQMTFAKGHYDSMYGRIVSEWSQEENGTRYIISVPPNTTATLYLIGKDIETVMVNDQVISEVKGVQFKERNLDRLEIELESGEYKFFVKRT